MADVLLDNDGEAERLVPQVNRLWADLAKAPGRRGEAARRRRLGIIAR